MNLHASVLLLNVAFLLSPVPAVPPVPESACVALAATLHYALLSCFTWMAIEGFNLYLLLGRVYNIYIRRYVLKLCALGWGKHGLPLACFLRLPARLGVCPLLSSFSSTAMTTGHHPCQHPPPLPT